jgi:sterol desaturase/sphingolipid hydroxylase (fatty acid hydroxylase superfamily)
MFGLSQSQQYLSSIGVELLRLCIWLVLLVAALVPLERIWPVRTQRFLRKAFGTDLVYYFVNAIAPKLLLVLPLSAVAAVAHHFGPVQYYLWIGDQPFPLRAAAALVIGEIGSYWGHRWSHEIPFLWRFHSLHHSAEEMDWLVNSRAHPIDMFFTKLCGLVPMYLLGLAQPMSNQVDIVPILITIIGTTWTFFIHANLKWRLGWLEWLVSSPAFHHWHHTNDGPDLINKNYSAILPFVDKVFGTFYLPKRWPGKYGINEPIPDSLAGQLLHPFSIVESQAETRPEQAVLR